MELRLLITLLFINFAAAQQKEAIYLFFDVENDIMRENNTEKRFAMLPRIQSDYFLFTKSNDSVTKVRYEEVKSKLISKAQANQKVRDYLEIKAVEFENNTGYKGNFIRNSPYNFNNYFTKIYIYEKIDEEWGYLYSVSWKYAIE